MKAAAYIAGLSNCSIGLNARFTPLTGGGFTRAFHDGIY